MSHSIFYNQGKKGRRFPISLLALETYSNGHHDGITEDERFDLFISVLTEICGVVRPGEDDLAYFLERLQAIHNEIQAEVESQQHVVAPKKPEIGFGTSYTDYISKLSFDSTVLRMTGYDYSAARKIYCELDRDDTMKLIKEYVTGLMEQSRVNLESSMYGFGNSYKNDTSASSSPGPPGPSGPNVIVHDINTEEGKAALRRCGFG